MIEHTIIKQKNYAYITVKQSPDYSVFVKASLNFVTDPGFVPELNRLCDLSQADLSHILMKDLIAFADFAKAQIPIVRSTRIALVAPDENRLGLFESFISSVNKGIFKVFVDPAEASAWLSEIIEAELDSPANLSVNS
jgi:hypothetical protein